jgi:hypothetical protein
MSDNKFTKDQDERNHKYCGFYGGYQGSDSLYFDDGKLEAATYSYEIGGVGNIKLSIEETKEIYKAMKLYFEKDLIDG